MKISELPSSGTITGTETAPVVQTGVTVKATLNAIKTWVLTKAAAITSATGSLILPSGTTAERDASPVAGYTRWNSTLAQLEIWYDATLTWVSNLVATSKTGSAIIPVGTTAERDGTPGKGYFRFNDTLTRFEGYNGAAWGSLGGATGGGSDAVFYINDRTVNIAYTVASTQGASTVGPITFNAAVTVNGRLVIL